MRYERVRKIREKLKSELLEECGAISLTVEHLRLLEERVQTYFMAECDDKEDDKIPYGKAV